MRLVLLVAATILMLLAMGCIHTPSSPSLEKNVSQAPPAQQSGRGEASSAPLPPAWTRNESAGGGANPGASDSAGAAESTGANHEADLTFSEWRAPDKSITLQVPRGWQAVERQVDNCTVNWAVLDGAGTRSAYMSNEMLVFKSGDARQIYKAYGLGGTDSAPVSGYLGAEAATQQIIAPLSGASDLQITYRDEASSLLFSQAMCAKGLAACDAQVFEAAYMRNGTLMRGEYMVYTLDLGDGGTWWASIWGYTSPVAQWNASSGTLERIFASVKYTDEWSARCRAGPANASAIIGEVVRNRQASTEKTARAWDSYISGG